MADVVVTSLVRPRRAGWQRRKSARACRGDRPGPHYRRAMRFGLSVPNMADPRELVALAVLADRNGWDGFFLWDHLQGRPAYAAELHDPWVVLGAVADRTERVRVGTLVTPVARRRPWVLAKQVTTLDHLSGGRAVLGVGLGEPPEGDFGAFGEEVDPRRRAAIYDEGLVLLDDLLRGGEVAHRGTHFRVDAQLRPAPVQRPRPPIWVAARIGARRPLARALRHEGLAPIAPDGNPPTPDAVAGYLAGVERPAGFDVVSSWAEGVGPDEYADAGVTWLVESRWPTGSWLDELSERAAAGPTA